jgi:hypothetical protein
MPNRLGSAAGHKNTLHRADVRVNARIAGNCDKGRKRLLIKKYSY